MLLRNDYEKKRTAQVAGFEVAGFEVAGFEVAGFECECIVSINSSYCAHC